MNIFEYNTYWMFFNLALALTAVIFGWFAHFSKNFIIKVMFWSLWLLFLPNTIYIISDLQHLFTQWSHVGNAGKFLLIIQYSLLEAGGLAAFFYALYPLEKDLKKARISTGNIILIILFINFLNGFAMVLGKIERLHSWYVFVAHERVINSTLYVLQTPKYLFLFLFFGVVGNLIYFFLLRPMRKLELNKFI